MKNTRAKLWTGSIGLLLAANFAGAQTWDGGAPGGNANWNGNNNWNPNGIPAADGTANILFSGSTKPNVNVNVSANVNSITFNPGVAFTLSGGSIALQGGGIINSAFNNTINSDLSLGASQSWQANGGNLSFGGATLNLGSFALDLSGGNNIAIANVISGNGSINKSGAGTVSLTGDNLYSGTTTVSAGTLAVNNATGSATGSGAVTVGSTATLTGGGSITGPVTMQNGSTLSAGNAGTGQITVGDLTLDNGPQVVFQVRDINATAGTGWDLINSIGTLTLSGGTPIVLDVSTLTLAGVQGNLDGFDNSQGYSWEFVRTTGGIIGFSESAFDIQLGNFANDTGMGDFNIFNDGNSLFLTFTPVPEPSTIAMGVIGSVMVFGSIMRRRMKKK